MLDIIGTKPATSQVGLYPLTKWPLSPMRNPIPVNPAITGILNECNFLG